jgi:hypothetical protein
LFSNQNPNLGKFWRVLLWKILVYFMTICSILRPLEIFYGHLVYMWQLGIFCGNLVYFWYFGTKKNLATLIKSQRRAFRSFVDIQFTDSLNKNCRHKNVNIMYLLTYPTLPEPNQT